MARKDRMDAGGAAALAGVALLLAFNQIIIKSTNQGLQPVFFAGCRSALAILFVACWMRWRGQSLHLPRDRFGPALLAGSIFAAEFLCLFMALDLTAVSRAAIIFYSMPVWMAILAHFGLPGERITRLKALGLALAFTGTAIALTDRGQGGRTSLWGDLLALGAALGWAGSAFMTRVSALRHATPEMQLLCMVTVSAPLLLLAAPLFGPLIRDLQPIHIFWLVFQASVVVAGGFITWLWLLSAYPAATVASFSFLTPVFGLVLGWAVLGEPLTPTLLIAGALVAGGIILINRR
jgi:drug/metabolite transporter (DMT)-like permease